ncbi:enoyl-CoA hydratase/isomerase family protein [Chungangia koreensis]|uniref:Enoyl-CoA hydratase/isomerase family protein n=1 Tax=Chungangia koreensis TaxID=752657 RepID=A0ABV8X3B5_9LACT
MGDLLFTVEGHVAKIVLNRPDQMNAFSKEMMDLWIEALVEIRDNPEIHMGIVTGNGRAFCAGGDVKAMINREGFLSKNSDDTDLRSTPLAVKNSLWKMIQRIPLLMDEIDKPMIAVVNGHAMGAGLDMALMCDIRIASERAKMGETYINAGIVPGDGGGYYLPRIIGLDAALEMFWTGKVLNAHEALDMKIVSHVVPHDELDNFVTKYCKEILKKPQEVVQMMKRIVKESQTMTLRQSLDYVSSQMAISVFHQGHEDALTELKSKFVK